MDVSKINMFGNVLNIKDATARSSIESINNYIDGFNVYNAVQYGLIPDGVTDNTEKLQALIDELAPGDIVFFPSGVYLTKTVKVFNKSAILFSGAPEAEIKANSLDGDIFLFSEGSNHLTFQNIIFSRIGVKGAASGNASAFHFSDWYANPYIKGYNLVFKNHVYGIYCDTARMQLSQWDKCVFDSCGTAGICLLMNNDEWFNNCEFKNCKNGAIVGGGEVDSDGAVYFNDCLFYKNNVGAKIEGSTEHMNQNVFFNGGIVDACEEIGISVKYSVNVKLDTCVTWSNGIGVAIGYNAYDINLNGLKIADCGKEGLYIDGGQNINGNLQIVSCGRSGSYFGINIVDYCYKVSLSGLCANGANHGELIRNTMHGGIRIISGAHGEPNGIVCRMVMTGLDEKIQKINGVNVVFEDLGASDFIGYPIGSGVSFAMADGAQRIKYDADNGIISNMFNFGAANSAWNSAHLVLGTFHIWVDSSGKMRIKNGAPGSDTDGTVVGTQT